jgi:glutaminyl-tRNA synthetase
VSAAHALDCTLRLYDKLFTVADPDDVPDGQDFTSTLNPSSLHVVTGAKVEPSVANDPVGTRYQFERTGYFMSDTIDSRPGALVFNRIVTLRDSWEKEKAKG